MSQSLERALTILRLVGESPRNITQLGQELDVHPTTALRLVRSLKQDRFLESVGDGTYRLGSTLIDLGYRALEQNDLRTVGHPHLAELNRITNETVHLAALDGTVITYVDKVESRHPVRIESHVGRSVLRHCTGVGKAILSYLPEDELQRHIAGIDFERFTPTTITDPDDFRRELELTRERGYAVDDEEHEPGICCVAVPIYSASGQVTRSLSVSAPSSRMTLGELLGFLPDIKAAGKEISEALGYRGRAYDAPGGVVPEQVGRAAS
jgi:DNA-binding IclR family transcriptional regulator